MPGPENGEAEFGSAGSLNGARDAPKPSIDGKLASGKIVMGIRLADCPTDTIWATGGGAAAAANLIPFDAVVLGVQ